MRCAVAASAREGLGWEAHAEALDEAGDARGVHLERVALAEFAERRGVRLRDATEVDELGKEALDAGRRDDLKNPAGGVPGVPERVPLSAGLQYEVAWAGLEDVVAEERCHAALQHVAVLV